MNILFDVCFFCCLNFCSVHWCVMFRVFNVLWDIMLRNCQKPSLTTTLLFSSFLWGDFHETMEFSQKVIPNQAATIAAINVARCWWCIKMEKLRMSYSLLRKWWWWWWWRRWADCIPPPCEMTFREFKVKYIYMEE